MGQRPVDRRWPGRVVCDGHAPTDAELAEDLAEVIGLGARCVGVPGRFVRLAPAEEIEGDHAATGAGKRGNEQVVEVQVVGKAVQQHDGRVGPRIVTCVNPVRPPTHPPGLMDRLGLAGGHDPQS